MLLFSTASAIQRFDVNVQVICIGRIFVQESTVGLDVRPCYPPYFSIFRVSTNLDHPWMKGKVP